MNINSKSTTILDSLDHCIFVAIAYNFQNRFVSPLLLVLAILALISAYCVNFADCSNANTPRTNRDNILVKRSYDQQELFEELPELAGEEGRTFSISNISYAITYITFVVALVMLAGFMWIAFSATGGGGGYGYSNRRILPDGVSDWFSSGGNYFGSDSDYERHKRSADSVDQGRNSISLYITVHIVTA